MTISNVGGPIVAGAPGLPLLLTNNSPPYNPDAGPSIFDQGNGILDPRFGYRNGTAEGSTAAYGFGGGGQYLVLDVAPSPATTAGIAALANAVNGTALTLAGASTGITVLTSPFVVPQTGLTVPTGALVLDGNPAVIAYAQNKTIAVADPRYALARAVSITGVAGGTGGAVKVAGYDLYGNPQTETITAAAGAATTNGNKGFKFIASVTPQFSDAHNYSVGTVDKFEFPLLVSEFAMTDMTWNNGYISVNTGFTAADLTNPATSTTGSVRGTYAVQSSSDGTKKLQIFVTVTPWNCSTVAGLFGSTPA